MNILFTILIIIWLLSGAVGCYLDFYHTDLTWKFSLGQHISVIIMIILASTSGIVGLHKGLSNYRRYKKNPLDFKDL